jgi:hypothetical protein
MARLGQPIEPMTLGHRQAGELAAALRAALKRTLPA